MFSDWHSSRDGDPFHCLVGCVLDFLQHLLELGRSTSTLKVYVLALAAHRLEFSDSSLGSDQLIVAFLKGANRPRGMQCRHGTRVWFSIPCVIV